MSVLKLLKGSKWKNVKVIATIMQSKYRSDKKKEVSHENETIEYLLTEVKKEGKLVKRMSAEKFYILNYQLTELIPLFSYLERLNALRFTVSSIDEFMTPGETRKSYRVSMTLPSNKIQEEMKENNMIKVVPTSETEKPTPLGDSVGECGICLDNLSDIMLPCLHAFCNQCIALW